MKTNVWDDARTEELIELFTTGISPTAIADRMKLSHQPVKAQLDALGLKWTPPKRKTAPAADSEREMLMGWPVHDPRKEWPIGCFEGQDVSQAVLDRELTRMRLKPPLRAPRYGIHAYEGPVT